MTSQLHLGIKVMQVKGLLLMDLLLMDLLQASEVQQELEVTLQEELEESEEGSLDWDLDLVHLVWDSLLRIAQRSSKQLLHQIDLDQLKNTSESKQMSSFIYTRHQRTPLMFNYSFNGHNLDISIL